MNGIKVNGCFLEQNVMKFKDGSIMYSYSFVNEFLGIFKVYSKLACDLDYNKDYNVCFVINKDLKKCTLKLKLVGIDEI